MPGFALPRRPIIEERFVSLNGRKVPYVLRRSPRARHVRLVVSRSAGLTVVVPTALPLRDLDRLIREHKDFILANLEKVKGFPSRNSRVMYLGRSFKFEKLTDLRGREGVRLEPGKFIVVSRSEHEHGAVLEKWFRAQARIFLHRKLDEFAPRMGVTPRRIFIRGQKTRWGTCSARGNVSFNWKLMTAPESVIEYVVVHELAHLRFLNHSRRFWEIVERYCPGWKECRKWLKEHEHELGLESFPA